MSTKDKDDLTLREMNKLIKVSGFPLENRIDSVLRDNGFFVETNQNLIVDDSPIEADVIASKMFDLGGTEKFGQLNLKLVIECKNSQQPLAFFLKSQQAPMLGLFSVFLRGNPETFEEGGKSKLVNSLLWKKPVSHHYSRLEIATQFCNFNSERRGNQREWKAESNARYHISLENLCKLTNEITNAEAFEANKQKNEVRLSLTYPILVLKKKGLVAVTQKGKNLKTKWSDGLIHSRSSPSNKIVKNTFITVIVEPKFPGLLRMIDVEVKNIIAAISDNRKKLMA